MLCLPKQPASASIGRVQRTLETPHLKFKPHAIPKPSFSEQLAADDRLAEQVAQPLFSAGIQLACITERTDYDSGGPGTRGYHEMRMLLQGKMRVQIGGRGYDLKPGDLVVCPASTPVRYSARKTGSWWLYFQIATLPAWEPLRQHGGYVRSCESAALLFQLLRDMLDARATHQPIAMARAQASGRMLAELLRLEMVRAGLERTQRSAAVQDLVEAVTESPAGPWDRRTLADRLHMSVSQATRTFKSELGVSPKELVIKQRMKIACEQLVNTDRKVKNIAADLGYDSLHAFTRLFRRHVGMPPGQYRARYAPGASTTATPRPSPTR